MDIELVRSILQVVFWATLVSVVVSPLSWGPAGLLVGLGGPLAFLALYGACLVLVARGRARPAVYLYMIGTYLGQVNVLLLVPGLEGQAMVSFGNLILSSGFMFGRRFALGTTMVCSASMLIALYLQSMNIWPAGLLTINLPMVLTSVGCTLLTTGGYTYIGILHMTKSRRATEKALLALEVSRQADVERARRADRLSVMAKSLVQLRHPSAIADEVAVGVRDALNATVTGVIGRGGKLLSVVGLGREGPLSLGCVEPWSEIPEGTDLALSPATLTSLAAELDIEVPEVGRVARGPQGSVILFALGPVSWNESADIAWSITTAANLLSAAVHRLEVEKHLMQAQKMDALGRLSAGIAHDFNNLLTTILGGAELVEHKTSTDDPIRKHLRGVREAGERAAALTRKLMAFTRAAPRTPKVVDVGAVLSDLSPMLRRAVEESIEVNWHLPDEAVWVDADPIDLERIILNLVINARDAIGERGRIDIGMEARTMEDRRECVVIWVQDDGEGMDSQVVNQIFEPFFTTRREQGATGLGLSIVYGVIHGAGGQIFVDSTPHEGSCFEIVFPRLIDPDMPEPMAEVSIVDGAGAQLLLVEDDPDVRETVSEMLRLGGFGVHLAASGLEALEQLETRAGISLVISDVVMPGMGGFDLARKMKEREFNVPIVLISGYAAGVTQDVPEDEVKLPRIAKPFSLNELLDFVHQQLQSSAS